MTMINKQANKTLHRNQANILGLLIAVAVTAAMLGGCEKAPRLKKQIPPDDLSNGPWSTQTDRSPVNE